MSLVHYISPAINTSSQGAYGIRIRFQSFETTKKTLQKSKCGGQPGLTNPPGSWNSQNLILLPSTHPAKNRKETKGNTFPSDPPFLASNSRAFPSLSVSPLLTTYTLHEYLLRKSSDSRR